MASEATSVAMIERPSHYRACPNVEYMCACTFGSARKNVRTRLLKNGCHGKQAFAVVRLVNVKENDCRFVVQREEHWIHTRPTRSITVGERLLELFFD